MKIDPTGIRPTTARNKVGGTASAGGSDFAKNLAESDSAGSASKTAGAMGMNPLAGLLAVQETEEPLERQARKRASQRADTILDELDEIRLGLLMGTIPMAKLEQLAQLVRVRREQFDDPKLQSILDDIELRAAVELAKLSRSL
ncbi:MAG TPA: flagellar assembly protein FliX [Dongiaceae bacterium]|nr:flagellar assembly protein FliX [Dongiaceae bacterium]